MLWAPKIFPPFRRHFVGQYSFWGDWGDRRRFREKWKWQISELDYLAKFDVRRVDVLGRIVCIAVAATDYN